MAFVVPDENYAQNERQSKKYRAVKTGSKKRVDQTFSTTSGAGAPVQPISQFYSEISPGKRGTHEQNYKLGQNKFFHMSLLYKKTAIFYV